MKLLKQIIFFILISVAMMSFSQCASTKKIENKSPAQFKEVYYKEWSNPARGMGSGLNLFLVLATENNDIVFDSVYFRRKQAKLTYTKNNTFVAKFKTSKNQSHDIIMSADPKEEYGNTMPEKPKSFPFELKDDECMVRYQEGGKTKYFKVSNIQFKKSSKSSNSIIDIPM